MATSLLTQTAEFLEDPLLYLPRSRTVEYPRGEFIYDQDEPSTSLCLVLTGKVKVARRVRHDRPLLVDIYKQDEFFGESALLKLRLRTDQALALEQTKLMMWSAADVQKLMIKQPRLAVALIQMAVQRTTALVRRIESFSLDKVPRRLARALMYFSERLGFPDEGGSVRLVGLTHELLSQYVGTSREFVTHYMNLLQQEGCLRYSRKGIVLDGDVLRTWLGGEGRTADAQEGQAPSQEAYINAM